MYIMSFFGNEISGTSSSFTSYRMVDHSIGYPISGKSSLFHTLSCLASLDEYLSLLNALLMAYVDDTLSHAEEKVRKGSGLLRKKWMDLEVENSKGWDRIGDGKQMAHDGWGGGEGV
jgi:hypothetical protein